MQGMKTWIPTTEVNRFQRCGIMKYSLSHTALLAKIDMTELNLQSGVKKKKRSWSKVQRSIQVKKTFTSNNSFFGSSNLYINWCRLLDLVRLTWFSLLALPKGQPIRSWAWRHFLQKYLEWMPEEHDGEVDAVCQRGRENIYLAWEQRTSLLSTRCSLFKSEHEQVLEWHRVFFWSKSGQTSRDRQHALTDIYACTEHSSEYSLFFTLYF